MPVSINEIKERVEVIAAKDQKTIYLNAAKFNKYAPIALDKIINEQRRKFEADLMSSDAVSELKVIRDYQVPSNGRLTKPSDYLYFVNSDVNSFYVNKNKEQVATRNSVDFMSESQYSNRVSSRVSPPTKQRPIMKEDNGHFQFFPFNVGIVSLSYLREPNTPVWAFTVVNNEQVYDAGNSVDFDLPYQFKDDLIWSICELLGVTVRQPDLIQASQALNIKA
jgi:hypothetical protein